MSMNKGLVGFVLTLMALVVFAGAATAQDDPAEMLDAFFRFANFERLPRHGVKCRVREGRRALERRGQ